MIEYTSRYSDRWCEEEIAAYLEGPHDHSLSCQIEPGSLFQRLRCKDELPIYRYDIEKRGTTYSFFFVQLTIFISHLLDLFG